jgi:hypothetical protein
VEAAGGELSADVGCIVCENDIGTRAPSNQNDVVDPSKRFSKYDEEKEQNDCDPGKSVCEED